MAVATAMTAIPTKPGLWSTIRLADGTEVRAERVGDEHGSWMQAADGTCYVLQNEVYQVADRQELQNKRAARLDAKYAKRRAIYSSTSDGLGEYGTMSMGAMPSIGEYTIPVVMVQFTDTKFKTTTTVEKMTRYYNEEGYSSDGCIGSVRDYFNAQSGGQFVPTFDVVGIVTLSKASSYYGQDQGDDYTDIHLDELPGDVISAAVSQLGVDFSNYSIAAPDNSHNAGVPLMCMLYAGKGQATESDNTTNRKLIWPCEWDDVEDLRQGDYQNVHFNSFFVGNELNTGGQTLMGLSVFCHEFGHALGLPDFYVTDYSYSNDDSFGNWSIMDTGAYVDDNCRKPMGYNAYEKSYMGWLDLKEFGDSSQVTLQSPLGLAENSAYIVRNSSSETFIFENRQPSTWYPSEYGSGVLVTRIAYSSNTWKNNTVNNTQSKKRACVLTADGKKLYYSASSSNLYGNAKTSITTLKTLSGSTKTVDIKNIQKNADGTITLVLKENVDPDPTPDPDPDPTPDPDPDPTPTPEGVIFYESFDQCSGTGGNDDLWSGSIASGAFVTDNEGWDAPKSYGANKCAKFGTSSIVGSATTPDIELDGAAVLTFKAGAWNGKNEGTALELYVEDGTVNPASLTMEKGAFTDYTVQLSATGTIKIQFVSTGGRFFLDEVTVSPVPTGISTVSGKAQKAARIYTLDGRYVGTDLQQLGHGLYIVNGKKVVR